MIITKILKPEKFNSTTLARLVYGLSDDEINRQREIDSMQEMLDLLLAEGIVG